MLSIPAQFAAAIARPNVRLVPLITLTLTQPSALTIRLSDRAYVHDGNIYERLLVENPTSRQGNVDPRSFQFTTNQMTLMLDNTRPVYAADRLSDLIYHPVNNPTGHIFEFAEASVYLVAEDTRNESPGAGNEVLQFSGILEAPSEITAASVKIIISDIVLALNKRLDLLISNPDSTPTVHEDDIGRGINIIYGSTKEVPTIRATSLGRAILLDDLDAGDLPGGRLRIGNCARFSKGGGKVVIGTEIFKYASAICKEDTGDVGTGQAGSGLPSAYWVSLSAGVVGSAEFEDMVDAAAVVHEFDPINDGVIVGFNTLVGNAINCVGTTLQEGPSNAATLVRIIVYRNRDEFPGTILRLTGVARKTVDYNANCGGSVPADDTTQPTLIVRSFVPPTSVAEIEAWTHGGNPPTPTGILGTFTLPITGNPDGTQDIFIGDETCFSLEIQDYLTEGETIDLTTTSAYSVLVGGCPGGAFSGCGVGGSVVLEASAITGQLL